MNRKYLILAAIAAAVLLCHPAPGYATSVLGSAQSFAVLGAAGVTNAHSDPNPQTTIWGNVGVDPGPLTAITGFPPGIVIPAGGTIYGPGDPSLSARLDATTAKTTLGLMGAGTTLAADLTLAGPLTPGVYTVPAGTTNLSGALTLDGLGDANALWVFQMSSTLITSAGSVVNVINTGSGAGVYWNVGSSASLGADTVFAGNIIATASVSLDPRAEILCGRAFALTGSVTLIDNLISNNNTAEDFHEIAGTVRPDYESYGFSGGSGQQPSVIPEPITLGGLFLGVGTLCGYVRRRARR
jgi:hypothetical protein